MLSISAVHRCKGLILCRQTLTVGNKMNYYLVMVILFLPATGLYYIIGTTCRMIDDRPAAAMTRFEINF